MSSKPTILISLDCTGPCKHDSTGLVSIRCVLREMRLFYQPSSSFKCLQRVPCHRPGKRWENSRISRTTQRIDTRLVLLCL